MELAYFHVGRDKNRGKNAKEIANTEVEFIKINE